MFVDFHLLFFYETSSFLHHRAHFSVIFFLRRLETLSFFGRRKTHRTWQCRKMNKKYRLVMIFFFFFNRVVVVSRQSCGGRVYWGWLWRSLRERNSCSVIFFLLRHFSSSSAVRVVLYYELRRPTPPRVKPSVDSITAQHRRAPRRTSTDESERGKNFKIVK